MPDRFEYYKDIRFKNEKTHRDYITAELTERLVNPSDSFDSDHLTLPLPIVIAGVPGVFCLSYNEDKKTGDVFVENEYFTPLMSPFKTVVKPVLKHFRTPGTEAHPLFEGRPVPLETNKKLTNTERYTRCEEYLNIFFRFTKNAFYGNPSDLVINIQKNYENLLYLIFGTKDITSVALTTDTVKFDGSDIRSVFENALEDMSSHLNRASYYAYAVESTTPVQIYEYLKTAYAPSIKAMNLLLAFVASDLYKYRYN